ncbi:hypothetical protein CEXT_781771 [Caerostris extrusa]|uniref:Uncharacterized protein n=1 Tax=Caerostris extrusa TaxID=172846 RepID=A0AAV4R4M3_CAEEX|nr:hypothetical protein CEXT_781771 [Caerostris extrusa]
MLDFTNLLLKFLDSLVLDRVGDLRSLGTNGAVLEQYQNAESQHLDGEPEIPLSVVKAAGAPMSEQSFDRSD